jgi:hypothetical protein
MVAIRPTYCNKISSIAIRLVAISNFLSSATSKANTSLFYFNKYDVTMFVLVYVDDIIVASSSQKATKVTNLL